jgi:DNA-binding PadR family transcriptional regulator
VSTRLLMLGIVRMLEPVHGYDVRRELLSWKADEWANIAPGSIYHALNSLARDGLITEVAGDERPSGRPARTKYRITDDGEVAFQSQLRDLWFEFSPAVDPFFTALTFIPFLPQDDLVMGLRYRLGQVRAAADAQSTGAEFAGSMGKPPHVGELFQLNAMKYRAEAEWLQEMIKKAEQGEFHAPWTPPTGADRPDLVAHPDSPRGRDTDEG